MGNCPLAGALCARAAFCLVLFYDIMDGRGEGEYMNIDKLRDKAALIAFQFLLKQEKVEYKDSKFIDIDTLSANAWVMAERFIDNRGVKCARCPYSSANTDEIIKAGAGATKPPTE